MINENVVFMNHEDLKKWAYQQLIDEGFKNDEIFFEFTINTKNIDIDKDRIRVDVVAIRNNCFEVAIECGNTQLNKIDVLKTLFKKVYIVPHDFLIKYKDLDVVDCKSCYNFKKADYFEQKIAKIKSIHTQFLIKIENLIEDKYKIIKYLEDNEYLPNKEFLDKVNNIIQEYKQNMDSTRELSQNRRRF